MDRDPFVHRVFLFPRRRLHLVEARAHDDFHVFAAQPPRAAAAVHRGIAPAQHDDALADFVMWPNDTLASQSMPMWMFFGASLAAGHVDVAAARRAAADEYRVVSFREHRLEAVDTLARRKSTPRSRM